MKEHALVDKNVYPKINNVYLSHFPFFLLTLG